MLVDVMFVWLLGAIKEEDDGVGEKGEKCVRILLLLLDLCGTLGVRNRENGIEITIVDIQDQ